MDTVENRHLRALFSEIVRGFSPVVSQVFGSFYIKHFNSFDIADIDYIYDLYYKKAISEGVPIYKNREEYLISEKIWDEDKELEISQLKLTASNLHSQLERSYLLSKRKGWRKQIEETEKQLNTLELEKSILIGPTAESYANKKSNEEYVKRAILKKDLKTNLFTDDEFENLSEPELKEIIDLYNSHALEIANTNLKKIALAPFFLQLYSLCADNPFNFYGKPIVELTLPQTELFGYGTYFRSVISSYQGKIPQDVMDDPNKLIDWIEINRTADSVLGKDRESSGSTIMGATKEDLKILGMEPNGQFSFSDELKKRGGKLNFNEFMKLHDES